MNSTTITTLARGTTATVSLVDTTILPVNSSTVYGPVTKSVNYTVSASE